MMELFESSSNWIMALGKTLVHSLWVGLLFLSILRVLYVFIPSRFASRRYNVAAAILLLFTGTVVAIFSFLYAPVQGTSAIIPAGSGVVFPALYEIQSTSGWLQAICYYSTFIYFIGILFYLIHTIWSISQLHSIRKSGEPVQGLWLERFIAFKARAGIGIRTLLLVSDRTDTPLLAGIVKPVIIVPAGMLTQLPFTQVEAILMHELFHLKRFDHLVNLFQRIVEMLFFFNPAVWSLSRIIRSERENCCDDLVLRECSRPLDYARALYQLAREQGNPTTLVPAATGNNNGQLKFRIQRILNPATMKTNIREKISALLLLAGGFLIVAIISGFSSGFSITQYNQAPEELSPVDNPSDPDPVPQVQPAPSPNPVPVLDLMPLTEPDPVVQPDTLPPLDETPQVEEPVDWEEIKQEIEEARQKAMEEIDWEEIKREVEAAKQKAMEEIDWEEIRNEMEEAKLHAMEEIDWEKIRKEIEEAKLHAMEEINWEEMKQEIESAMESIDWEEIERELEEAKVTMEEINWDEIKMEIEEAMIHMDSFMQDFDFDMDMDFDHEEEEETEN